MVKENLMEGKLLQVNYFGSFQVIHNRLLPIDPYDKWTIERRRKHKFVTLVTGM